MSGFPIVDLILGIIFVYFILSIMSSSAVEIIMTILKARPTVLKDWFLAMFNKKIAADKEGTEGISLGQAIMDHSIISGLTGKGKSPSYVNAKDFAAALLEKISFDPKDPVKVEKDIDGYIEAIKQTNLVPDDMKRVLLGYAYEIQGRVEKELTLTVSKLEMFGHKIEDWYDSSMQRLSGELKRRYSVPITAVVAVILTVTLNADSVALARYLYSNPEVSTNLANAAINASQDTAFINRVAILNTKSDSTQAPATVKSLDQQVTDFDNARKTLTNELPLVWKGGEFYKDGEFSFLMLIAKIAGLLATILAIMMGAPFWFDLINKISNLRNTGNKPQPGSSAAGRQA